MSKRKESSWIKALKEYNRDSTVWALPRKGGPEYKKVVEIMNIVKTNKKLEAVAPDLRKIQPRNNISKEIKVPPAPDLRKLQPKK